MTHKASRPWPAAALLLALPPCVPAAITVHEDGDEYVRIGGRVQFQYHYADADGADATDEVRVRRAWLTFDAAAFADWRGRLQFQLNDGAQTQDAWIRYSGWDFGTLTAGNFYVPFAREELTSTKRQQLVEKTLVAGTGSPERQLGVGLSGGSDRLGWSVGLWEAGLATDTDTIRFASQVDERQDFEGRLVGARIEYHPRGDIGFGQGNLAGADRWELAAKAFAWSNDGDARNDAQLDYDTVEAIGIDGAWRRGAWSVDAEVNAFRAETLGGGVDAGIVENGDAELLIAGIEGGYVLGPARGWEVVAGVASEDAEAWEETETQAGIGVNRFFRGHDAKLQASYIDSSDVDGVAGADRQDLFVQLQFAF